MNLNDEVGVSTTSTFYPEVNWLYRPTLNLKQKRPIILTVKAPQVQPQPETTQNSPQKKVEPESLERKPQ